ncbi:pilus (MSHA type) biogenesis protein MshL [Massilia pseudoviolaceinigra]|uniref:pilus (MSHA type) biogenesis protein MshL n=1 Tax=Massilia pseudoviolaceinigra TaxID=3057165 RepID=UPI00279640D6|nr:pilus (MSHA type) biogenesis protein MshL [Massilia sp. CCM 9206]MDQ1921153.1 pilus (MSHA type) biogenesis protein MshL [Massilia sp. CCM 9206]
MQKQRVEHLVMASVMASAVILAGCNATPKRDTYENITAQMAAAARPVAATARPDDAVAAALLPPVAALAGQLPKSRQALEERFNVSFNNVPAQQFFNSIATGTRYNMLVHPEVSGNISANLKDVTLAEALDAVREMYGYEYRIEGNRVSIKPLTMQTRMFQVNYLVGNRKGKSNLRVTSTSITNAGTSNSGGSSGSSGQGNNNSNNNSNDQNGGGTTERSDSSNVSTTSDSDFWVELKASIAAIVGSKEDGRTVVVNPQSGVVVIRAMPEELRNVDLFLKATQLSVGRQVILEAKILEVELNDSFQSGINWASFASFPGSHGNRVSTGFLTPGTTLQPLPFGTGQPPIISDGKTIAASTGFLLSNAAATAGSMFGLAFQTSNFAALISFLESQGTVHVLSSPRIATINNQKAVLKIGTDEFYVTGVSTTTSTGDNNNTVSPSVTLQPFFSGVVLDVTPQIDDKGNILLHVHPSVSQVTTVNKSVSLGSAGNLSLPLAASSTSEIDSMVRGQDGRVVAIGGLMRQSSTADGSQVPGAGSLPVIGGLFRNKANVNQKRELVVLIKPTIVDGPNGWNQDLLDTSRRFDDLDPNAAGRR